MMNKNKQKLLQQLNHEFNSIKNPNGKDIINQIEHHQTFFNNLDIKHRPYTNDCFLITPVVIALLALNIHTRIYTYHSNTTNDDANHAYFINSFSTLHILTSLHLADIIDSQHKNFGEIQYQAKITPLGKQFIHHFLPTPQQKNNLLKSAKSVRIIKHHPSFRLQLQTCLVVLDVVDLFAAIALLFVHPNSFILSMPWWIMMSVMWLASPLNHLIEKFPYRITPWRIHHFKKLLTLTKFSEKDVMEFLNQHHIQEPNVHFDFDNLAPRIGYFIFLSPNQEIQKYKKIKEHKLN